MVFAMTLIPAILYSLLNLCGINIAHDYIEPIEQIKTNNYYSYAHYPFAVQLHNSVRVDLVSPYRICGIYNEAGLVGTVCSLFLTADKFQFKRKWDNVILLVGGFLSFSMAFYFMVIVYYALVNLGKHKLKNAIALSSIIILFFVFMNFEFSNPALSSLQARLQITQEGLVGDNRTNERFDAIYSSIYDDPTALFIGYGMGEIGAIQRNLLLDGSSYKCLIYDYGYIGFGLFIIWIFYAVNIFKGQKNNLNIFILLFMYIINIYQRPTMFYPAYLIILIGGCCKMSEKNPLIKIGANRLI